MLEALSLIPNTEKKNPVNQAEMGIIILKVGKLS
jgi:hypothetical protein